MLKGVGRVYQRQYAQQAATSLCTGNYVAHRAVHLAVRAKSSSAAIPDASWSSPENESSHSKPEDAHPSIPVTVTKHPSQQRDSTRNSKSTGHDTTRRSAFTPHLPYHLMTMVESLLSGNSHQSAFRSLRSSPLSEHFQDRAKATLIAETMARSRHPHRAKFALALAYRIGCSFKQSTYESVAFQLAGAKHWRFIHPVVVLGRRQSGRTTVRLLNWQIRATIELANFANLETVLDEFEAEGLRANQRTYHLLISGHLRNNNLRLARENMKKMEDAGFSIDSTTHATVLSAYRTLGPAMEVQDHAFQALKDVDQRTKTIILNNLLQLYFDANDVRGVLHVLPLFRSGDSDVPLSQEMGINTIPYDGNGSMYPSPSIPPSSVTPDLVTFTILMNHVGARRNLPSALRLFGRMLSLGLVPDIAAVSALLRAYFKAGEEKSAVGIIAEMCRSCAVPSSLFVSLGLDNKHQWPLPLSIKGIPPTAEVFNALMRNSLNRRGLKGARIVLRIMRYCHVEPDPRTIEIFMSYLERVQEARPRDLIRVLRNLTSGTTRPSLNHIHIIMRAVFRREKFQLQGSGWDVAAAKFSPSRRDHHRHPEDQISGTAAAFDPTAGIELPNMLSYRGLIKPIVQSLSSRHIMSNRATIMMRLKHEAVGKGDLNTARAIFEQMLARGMHPTKHHYAALMEGYAQSGDMRGAENVMTAALDAGIRPNVVMFTILLVGHARKGSPGAAIRTFRIMVAAGIRPDAPVVDALAGAYFAVGDYKVSKRVLLAMWPHVQLSRNFLQRGVRLKRLAQIFRRSDLRSGAGIRLKGSLSKYEQTLLRWKMDKIVRAWTRIRTPNRNRGSQHRGA
ncbi:hypothetical protein FIBSPDRAFT_44527 [Athelia psychrophila]|uniref:Pentacotripeptide-repeat region of PRORP domain-containing protein n=1 Tax=Athelia psychrophila TaxID=1759441 RepID=A0A166U1U0_9AGAM|nr:hypothetical protein FIBSPDRAFT_44527 [Fibularhizoctonia sp. CBS 109695]